MPKKNQMSDEKISNLKKWDLLNTFWVSWTQIIGGFIEEDYRKDLQWRDWATTYDEMRKSDAQVFATLLACELPIRSTKWYIEAWENTEWEVDDISQEIADFISSNLFEKMNNTFDDFLRETLTMLAFGFSVFEKTYRVENWKIYLDRLWFRKQNTIYKWLTPDNKPWITQLAPWNTDDALNENQRSNNIWIPAEKLLIFSFRQEWRNYEGCSILRSAYKHWYIKDKLYKFDAVRHERQSVWIPIIYLPKSAWEEDKIEAKRIVKNIRSTEQTWIVMPWPKSDGWEFEFADIKAWQTTNLYESIKHHNREISKNILAQFLELWDTQSWSRALSEDQSDLFLLSLQAVAKQISETINRYLIPEIVDLNYDIWEAQYPKLRFQKLWEVNYTQVATNLSTLASSWLIEADEDLEKYIRETLELPKKFIDEELDRDNEELDRMQEELWTDEEDSEEDSIEEEINACEIENIFEEFKIIDEETKNKISEALKKYWASRWWKSNNDLKKDYEASKWQSINIRDSIKQTRDYINTWIAEAKQIKDKKIRKAKISELRQKLKEYRLQMKNKSQSEKENRKKIKEELKNRKSYIKDISDKLSKKQQTVKDIKEIWWFDEDYFNEISSLVDNRFITNIQNECRTAEDLAVLKKKWFKFNEYESKSYRPLTFAERKVNFSSISNSMETYTQILEEKLNEIWQKIWDDLLLQIKKAVENNDIKALWEIKAKYKSELSQTITDIQKEMFEIWKKTASTEIWVSVPPTKAEVRWAMRVQNDALVEKIISDVETAGTLATTQIINKKGGSITSTGSVEAISWARESIDNTLTKWLNTLTTLWVTGAINLGRSSIFERYPEKVYAMQYSAILDGRTTARCLSLDWRVVKPWSPEFYKYSPPQHYGCRSIWVEILVDETFKPDITWIPNSIPEMKTIDSKEELKYPVLLKNSPAISIVKKELEETKTKLQELEKNWTYPNRQETYKTKILELEKSLKNEFCEYTKSILMSDWINFE